MSKKQRKDRERDAVSANCHNVKNKTYCIKKNKDREREREKPKMDRELKQIVLCPTLKLIKQKSTEAPYVSGE